MPYQIGDKRFPWFARFFRDPGGQEPREISKAPVQTTVVLNTKGSDTLAAFSETAFVNVAAGFPGNPILWTFEDGRAASSMLPSDYEWIIHQFGVLTNNSVFILKWKRWRASGPVGDNGILTTAGVKQVTSYAASAAIPMDIASQNAYDWYMPYGGGIYVSATGAPATGNVTACAYGRRRELL